MTECPGTVEYYIWWDNFFDAHRESDVVKIKQVALDLKQEWSDAFASHRYDPYQRQCPDCLLREEEWVYKKGDPKAWFCKARRKE